MRSPPQPFPKDALEWQYAAQAAQLTALDSIPTRIQSMCICINCHYVDDCQTYHAVEGQHQQPHLTETPAFEPQNPTINVNIRTGGMADIQLEWDVVGCDSFQAEMGKWAKLRPGELIPT